MVAIIAFVIGVYTGTVLMALINMDRGSRSSKAGSPNTNNKEKDNE